MYPGSGPWSHGGWWCAELEFWESDSGIQSLTKPAMISKIGAQGISRSLCPCVWSFYGARRSPPPKWQSHPASRAPPAPRPPVPVAWSFRLKCLLLLLRAQWFGLVWFCSSLWCNGRADDKMQKSVEKTLDPVDSWSKHVPGQFF